jgi:hypothetical protein
MGALLFVSVTWCEKSLYWLGVQGVRVLLLLGGLLPAKCGSSFSAEFLISRAHAVCFCPLVTILGLFVICVMLLANYIPEGIYLVDKIFR